MYFDTHAHYDDAAFDEDRDSLLKQVNISNVSFIINPGCDVASSLKAKQLSSEYDFIYYAAGLHPEEVSKAEDNYLELISDIADNPKCVAIGEIGLDYYWDASNKENQKKAFISQLELSVSKDLPVIIHDREAHGDCLEIVRSFPNIRGVFHCYSGSSEMAQELLKLGFYLGFDGPITYKNNKKTIDVLINCPMDRILIETDSPYLSPVPMRGKRNDSRNLQYIVQKIAEIKNLSVDEVSEITYLNAKRCFNI